MPSSREPNTITDASKPNAGRIYDYLLGGNHNFEIDRDVSEKLMKMAPFLVKAVRIIRWFLGEATRRSIDRGFNKFIDFASGLPTVDHIHSITKKDAKVIYSDIDPVTVEYGKEIIGDNPNVKYQTCDAAKPEELLKLDIVKNLFENSFKVSIGFNGVAWFLTDTQINHAMKVLYDWTDEGSILFITDVDGSDIKSSFQEFSDIYKNMNQPIFLRPKEELIKLVKPWNVENPGFISLENWIGISSTVTEEAKTAWGGKSGLIGGFLRK